MGHVALLLVSARQLTAARLKTRIDRAVSATAKAATYVMLSTAMVVVFDMPQMSCSPWPEWSTMLGEEIKKAQSAGDPDTGDTYYHHWLATLERMVAEKGAASAQALAQNYQAWERATHRTPHGKPMELKPEDFGK